MTPLWLQQSLGSPRMPYGTCFGGGSSDSSSSSSTTTNSTNEDNRVANSGTGGIAAGSGSSISVTNYSTDLTALQSELQAQEQIVGQALSSSSTNLGMILTAQEASLAQTLGLASQSVGSVNQLAQSNSALAATALDNAQPANSIIQNILIAASIIFVVYFATRSH